MSNPLTRQQFEKVLPRNFKGTVSDQIIDDINAVIDDPGLRENFRDNLLGFSTVLKNSHSWGIQNYVDACKFVSYRMLGDLNIDAYVKTFPDRYQRMLNENMLDKHIASVVSAYSKGELVIRITEQTLMPTWIVNAETYQKAINVLAELMIGARSEKVRADSAASILVHLKRPEAQRIELDVGMKESDAMNALMQKTKELAELQIKAIESGNMSVKDVAHAPLMIEGQSEEVSNVHP